MGVRGVEVGGSGGVVGEGGHREQVPLQPIFEVISIHVFFRVHVFKYKYISSAPHAIQICFVYLHVHVYTLYVMLYMCIMDLYMLLCYIQ